MKTTNLKLDEGLLFLCRLGISVCMGVIEWYSLSPGPSVHEYTKTSLQDEEKIHPQPDRHGYIEISMMREKNHLGTKRVFVTNSNYNVVDISNYEFCSIKGLHHQVAKIKGLENLILCQRLNSFSQLSTVLTKINKFLKNDYL